MMRQALALGMELSVLIVGAYFIHGFIAEAMGWNPSLVLVGLFTLVFIGWITHVYYFYERQYKDS